MTNRLKFISLALALLVAHSLPSIASNPPKAGAACVKVGANKNYKGKKFTCVKNGNKTVWKKGVASKEVSPKPIQTIAPTPTPSPIATPTPTPSPTPTERILINLPMPGIKNLSFRKSVLSVTLEVAKEALGGFIKVPALGIEKKDSLTPKDENGIVRISLRIENELTARFYDVQAFAYGEGTESNCCSGSRFNSLIPPMADEPTFTYGTPELNPYKTPPVITSKPKADLSEPTPFSDLTACRLPDGDPQLANMTVGFPLPQGRVDFTKRAVVQLLPVSFKDIPGESDPLSDYENGVSAMKQFWEAQSFVGTEIEVRSPRTYKPLPNPVLSYELASSLFGFQSEKYRAFVRYVVSQYDAEIDFSGVSTIVLVLPPSTTSEQVGTWVVDTQTTFATNEGNIYNYMLTGSGDRKNESGMWVHEYGHALGLTDMRFVDQVNPTIQRPEGLGVFDIMGSGNTVPETLVWSRFLLNILAPQQLLCITNPGTSTHWIRPLTQRSKDLKGVVVPTGTYTALVIESRRSYGFDSYLSPRDNGLLVYRVDTRIGYKRSPVQIIQPARSKDKEWYTDSALKVGETVIADGWKFTVIESGEFGDVVRIEKA